MNKPITLCDRCKEYARCCLNYDGDNCRRSRTVEPTNADRIRAMTDKELAEWIEEISLHTEWTFYLQGGTWLDWLKKETEEVE